MRILHLADTHLGFSAYRKVTEEGINQRELDVYKVFEEFIDYALEVQPDLVVHAGDLFDAVRPNNRAITFSLHQLLRLSQRGIPIVMIAGNHEHPKLRETGHIFSIFEHLENVYPIYQERYETVTIESRKESLTVHALPQCNSLQEFNKGLRELTPSNESTYNLLLVHGAVTGVKAFSMNEFNELIIPTKTLHADFDYMALGHYHKYTQLSERAYYAGSTECLTFTDANDKKGFIDLELQGKNLTAQFMTLGSRPMVEIAPIPCSHLQLDEIMSKIKQTVREVQPKDKTVRITLEDIPQQLYRSLDFAEIRKLSSDAIHFEIKAMMTKDEGVRSHTSSKIDALVNEFEHYLEQLQLEDKETLLKLGIGYIEKIEAQREGST
jgi:exonuclease SbcD